MGWIRFRNDHSGARTRSTYGFACEQEYEYLDEIYAGDTISCSAKVTAHVKKRRMDIITIEVVYKRDCEVVLISRSNIIERKG